MVGCLALQGNLSSKSPILIGLCTLTHYAHPFGVAFDNLSSFGRLWLNLLHSGLFEWQLWCGGELDCAVGLVEGDDSALE